MNLIDIKAALEVCGYTYVSINDCGKYFIVNAQPAQVKDNRLQLGNHLRDLGCTVTQHHNYLDTEIAHAKLKGQE